MKTNLERQRERLRKIWQAVVEAEGNKKARLLESYHREAEAYQDLKNNYASMN